MKVIFHFYIDENYVPICKSKEKNLYYKLTKDKSKVTCPKCIKIICNQHLFVK